MTEALFASTQDLTLNKIGLSKAQKRLKTDESELIPTPLIRSSLIKQILEPEVTNDPMVIRPRIEYDDYLRIRTLPKVLGINLLLNY